MMQRSVSRRVHVASLGIGIAIAVLATGWFTPGSASVPGNASVPAGTPPAPPALTSFKVTAAPAKEQIDVSWSYSPAPVTGLHLELYQVAGGRAVEVGRTTVGNTVEPRRYTIPVAPGTWAVRATPENATGSGVGITSAPVTVRDSCAPAGLCVTVTNEPRPTAIRLVGQGFLHGTTSWTTARVNAALVPLEPRQLRSAGPAVQARATQVHASSTQILSDLWNNATARAGYAKTPWSDWNRWRSFVAGTVSAAERQGWAPDYWDVWNEPNGTCCPRFSPLDLATVSVDRWLETYVVAWQAIRSVDPHAQVIGPSLSALQWAPGSPREFDLDTFLAYSAAHHVVWSAISWHENSAAPSSGDIGWSLTSVDRHVAMARAVMARHPGTVVGDRIFINEYDPANTHVLAGWAVGYFRVFEADGVSQANLACWDADDCITDLDGLLTPAGRPTAVWWAHRAYALLANEPQMEVTSNASWQLDGLATRDDARRTVRVLLGRHYGCDPQVNPWCTYDSHITPASVAITIAWPYGAAPVTLRTYRLPAGYTALAAPVVIGSTTVRPVNGRLTVRVAAVADGDALSLVARTA